MENKKDYEQMYYDSQYEIKQLKKKIKYLEDTIYLNNDGYKFSYSDTLEGYLKQVKQYYIFCYLL